MFESYFWFMKKRLVLLLILIILISPSFVSSASRGSLEVPSRGSLSEGTITRGTITPSNSDSLDALKATIEECKKLAEAEKEGILGAIFTDRYNPNVGIGRAYSKHDTGVYSYDCKEKDTKLYWLDRARTKDIHTTIKFDLEHPAFGETEVFFDINGAKLIDNEYFVDIHTMIDGLFARISNKRILKSSFESKRLTEKERAEIALSIAQITNKYRQLASDKNGVPLPAKGDIKSAVPGEQKEIFGFIPLNDWWASKLYHKEMFYYDSDGEVVMQCPIGYCKSAGFYTRKEDDNWRIRNQEGKTLIKKSNKWIPAD